MELKKIPTSWQGIPKRGDVSTDYLMYRAMDRLRELQKEYVLLLASARTNLSNEITDVVNGYRTASRTGPLASHNGDVIRTAALLSAAAEVAKETAAALGYERPEFGTVEVIRFGSAIK